MIPTYVVWIPKRKAHVAAFLGSLGLDGIFLPPVMRDDLDHATLVRDNVIAPDMPTRPGYMGKVACSLAHVNVLTAFLRSGEDAALVFEDDNHIPNDVTARENIMPNIETFLRDPSWQFLNL
jgi:GR25 family glycosyltransferase involved in LPS biosynthesis